MYKKNLPKFIVLIFIVLIITGCFSENNLIIYESHATKISYRITYGYQINCSGEGELTILYDCDTPEVLKGTTEIKNILDKTYISKTIATHNDIISWNITTTNCTNYKLGLTANIVAESSVISDLNGENALNIQQIKEIRPDLINKYCNLQANETITFINPTDLDIINLAYEQYEKANSDNALIVAKELFKWLKEKTIYTTHIDKNNVQTSSYTLEKCTGDCDDLSFLYISLCRAVKIPARFIRGFLVEDNNAIPHAWTEVYVGGGIGNNGWISVECAGTAKGDNKLQYELHQNFGIESANYLRLFIDDGSNESLIESFKGISYLADSTLDIDSPSSLIKVQNYMELESHELHVDKNNIRKYR